MSPRARVRTALVVGLCAAFAGWGVGFAWFVHAAGQIEPPPPQADGIVAFTGGAERVETALRLLAEGRARRLLVSGVGGDAVFRDLALRAHVGTALAGAVTLGRTAASTRGNAAETAEWARANALRSLIVVTAGYHMPRALTELSRALPKVALFPVPVMPPALRGDRGVATLRLLAGEYTKWLAAAAGLTGWPGWTEDRIEPCHPAPPRAGEPRAAEARGPEAGCRDRSRG